MVPIVARTGEGKEALLETVLAAVDTLGNQQPQRISYGADVDQVLDDMKLEQERGITIKLHAVQMRYRSRDGQEHLLHLIDTPGHVDFSYEVSRSLAACEGALLVVDASQGVEAQTISNLYLAIDAGLEIIPVINKIDLPSAMVDTVRQQLKDLLGCGDGDIVLASAKTNEMAWHHLGWDRRSGSRDHWSL